MAAWAPWLVLLSLHQSWATFLPRPAWWAHPSPLASAPVGPRLAWSCGCPGPVLILTVLQGSPPCNLRPGTPCPSRAVL